MKLQSTIASGSFGIVYSVTTPDCNRPLALKRNLVDMQTNSIGSAREVDILCRLRHHPNVVRLDSVALADACSDFTPLKETEFAHQKDDVMHFLFPKADFDLHGYINSQKHNFREMKSLMVDILLGVEYMHALGITHRDLKPGNVLIFNYDGVLQAKLCDLGLSKFYTCQGIQTPNMTTHLYRAPEVALGSFFYNFAIDIWALGCIFFEMVSNRRLVEVAKDGSNPEILAKIIALLPKKLSESKIQQMKGEYPAVANQLPGNYNGARRQKFQTKLGLSSPLIKKFERNNYDNFCDLLDNILRFDPGERLTASECLDHRFFKEEATKITTTRTNYPPVAPEETVLEVYPGIERRWAAHEAVEIFNHRDDLQWYSPRILFQAFDLFDRYLLAESRKVTLTGLDITTKGAVFNRTKVKLYFYSCLYLSVKYFSTLHLAHRFTDVAPTEFHTPEYQQQANQFETRLIIDCLQYQIYRPTVYEAADQAGIRIGRQDIYRLLTVFITKDPSKYTPSQLFTKYWDNWRQTPIEDIIADVTL